MEFFYLWTTNKDSFDIFRIIRPYISGDGDIPVALIIELVRERELQLQKIIEDIPLILNGFNKVLSSAQQNSSKEQTVEEIPFN